MAIFSLLLATFLFSLFGVFTRIISESMGVFYQLWVRTLIMVVLFVFIGIFTRSLVPVKKKDFGMFAFRGFLILSDFASFTFAVNSLPLGLTLFLFYAASVTSNFIYGTLFLREKITFVKLIGFLFAFIGLIFIFAGNFTNIKIVPSFFAIISGVCFGLNTSTSKKLTEKYSVIQVNLVGYLITTCVSFFCIFIAREDINIFLPFPIVCTIVGFAIVSVAAFYLTLYGFKKIEAQKGGLIMLAELIFVILIGNFLYREIPTANVVIGGIFITLALALPNLSFQNFFHPRRKRSI